MDSRALLVLQSFGTVCAMNGHPGLNRVRFTRDASHLRIAAYDVSRADFYDDPVMGLRMKVAPRVAWWLNRFRDKDDPVLRTAALFWGACDMFWREEVVAEAEDYACALGRDEATRQVLSLAKSMWPLIRDANENALIEVWDRLQRDGELSFDSGREVMELAGALPSRAELANAVFH